MNQPAPDPTGNSARFGKLWVLILALLAMIAILVATRS